MKKGIALFLAILLVLILSACGGGGTANKPDEKPAVTNAPKTEQGTKEEAPTDSAQKTEPVETEPIQTEPVVTEPVTTEPTPTEPAPPEFEEITVIDNKKCLMKITGIEQDSFWGYSLKVYLENRSSDKTYMFSCPQGAVNGVSWDPLFATEVAPGKKKNDEISFMNDKLEELLPVFTDIELVVRVYDSNDWLADDVAKETVHIYPYGEEKATVYTREDQPTDTVIVDNKKISIIVTDYEEDDIWGYTANVYLVNKTNATLMFSVDDVSVNGYMCDPFWATEVGPRKVAFSGISWSESSFEENGITTVEDIEMTIRVYDSEHWSGDDIYKKTITLNP